MVKQLWHFLLRIYGRLFRRAPVYRVQHVDDAPGKLSDGIVYLVGADGHDWSALMRCPGGCGKTLEMNLLPDTKPVWRATVHGDSTVSLHPSVWLKTGCGCHFVLQGGRVRWV